MTPYLDAGFLLTLLVKSSGNVVACHVLNEVAAPFGLNFLHQLQAENLLKTMEASAETDRQMAGRAARRLWQNYLVEGIFQFVSADWDSSFQVAVAWNDQYPGKPPPPLLLLHPALAAVAGAKEFLSFDPRSRAAAKAAGLQVLPQRL